MKGLCYEGMAGKERNAVFRMNYLNLMRKCSVGALCAVALSVVLILQLVLRDANKQTEVIVVQERTASIWSDTRMPKIGKQVISANSDVDERQDGTIKLAARDAFAVVAEQGVSDIPRLTSDKNQIMDALLNQSQIPADYGETMVALFRDQSQDVLTRDFAVQHIGLYAPALERRGEYAPDSADARECRAALFEAAGDTRTIVAAAAFRALADIANFDSRIDASRLDSLLVASAADASSAPASRSMAVQLCGERRVNAARPALEAICADSSSPEILRRSASRSLAAINGH